MVVTMQDLAPLDEIERLRTDFLSLVSHELRAPLTSITGLGAHAAQGRGASWTRPRCASSSASSTSRPARCAT